MSSVEALGYEASILAAAERNGWTTIREGDFIRVMDAQGRDVLHRLGGDAEAAYEQRQRQEDAAAALA